MIKFYIIHKKDDATSESFAKECQESANRFSVETEMYPGIYENIDEIMKEEKLFINPLYKYKVKNRGIIGCFLSHYFLWKQCLEKNINYGILEHDAKFIRHLPDNLIVNDYLNLDFSIHEYFHDKDQYEYSLKKDNFLEIHSFEGYLNNRSNSYNEKIKKTFKFLRRNFIRGTHGYIISPVGAKKLIDAAKTYGIMSPDIHANLFYINIQYTSLSIVRVNKTMLYNIIEHSHCINDKTIG